MCEVWSSNQLMCSYVRTYVTQVKLDKSNKKKVTKLKMRNVCDLLNFIAMLVIGYMKTIRASTDIYVCETDNVAYLGDIKIPLILN